MTFQFGNHETWKLNNASKRRMDDDDDTEEECIKRQQQHQQQQQQPKLQADLIAEEQSELPSITYASPDYRPPPRPDALWLQPMPPPPPPTTTTTMMDEDLTDEDDSQSVLTPSSSLQHSGKAQFITNASSGLLGGYGVQYPM